jgi:lipopolysaccharide/colanic/teichoic acid biosynthesis glycosyltransferase
VRPARLSALRLRAVDLGLALLLAPIWCPLLLLGMAGALVFQGLPIFYRAERLGRGGATFRMLKLRTMVRHADRRGPAVASSADVRITPVGRILRRTKLDELPQFLHVLTGEMSIVGPRPEAPAYLQYYTEAGLRGLAAKPGITGYGALYFFSAERSVAGADFEDRYVREILPTRLLLDERCWTQLQARPLRTTLRLVLLTGRLVLLRGSMPTSPAQLAARFLL